jgi:hypothetical protein
VVSRDRVPGESIGPRRTAAIEFQSLSLTSTASLSAASNALENLSGMIRNPNTPAGGSSGRMNEKPNGTDRILSATRRPMEMHGPKPKPRANRRILEVEPAIRKPPPPRHLVADSTQVVTVAVEQQKAAPKGRLFRMRETLVSQTKRRAGVALRR